MANIYYAIRCAFLGHSWHFISFSAAAIWLDDAEFSLALDGYFDFHYGRYFLRASNGNFEHSFYFLFDLLSVGLLFGRQGKRYIHTLRQDAYGGVSV